MLDPVQLRTFLAVAEAGGFSEAARRLALGQSTVSQQIRRLEAAVGRELFARDTHRVTLTGDGEVMTGFARSILDQQDMVMRYFSRPELRGRIRLGVSEDLVLGRLPEVLRRFRRSHPMVDLELTVELSAVLHDQLAGDKLDLVLAKRGAGAGFSSGAGSGSASGSGAGSGSAEGGMWTDPLVWVGAPGMRLDRGEPVPLVVYPEPSITRTRALESLRRNGFSWRIACTCDRLNGLRAATLAGLGVAVFAESVVPDGLSELADPLPDPGSVVFALTSRRPVTHGPVAALAEVIGSYPWRG